MYPLRIPVGKKELWNKYEVKPDILATDYKRYSLRGYANLKQVGKKFKVPRKVLQGLNPNKVSKKLTPKTSIILPFHEDHNPRKKRLYADLYERPRKSILRKRTYQKWIKRGKRKGDTVSNPTEFYTVKKGDTLWSISRKTGVNINTIIKTNYKLVKRRMILPGDKLAIK
jgi:membrane-bound lytic murein transglycosylase D